VEQAIRELHSYELPAIHAWTFDAIHAPYAEWIVQSCEATAQDP
jgi:periplasmic divalent cation tolerance protein